jgi:hypothetical protein
VRRHRYRILSLTWTRLGLKLYKWSQLATNNKGNTRNGVSPLTDKQIEKSLSVNTNEGRAFRQGSFSRNDGFGMFASEGLADMVSQASNFRFWTRSGSRAFDAVAGMSQIIAVAKHVLR